MHELPVSESILEIALRHGRQNGAIKITRIQLVIGQLSSFIDDSIRFYWGMIAEGTMAQDAELIFRRIPVEMRCQSCQEVYTPGPNELACPKCGSTKIKVIKGDEFFLESIDIEKTNQPGRSIEG